MGWYTDKKELTDTTAFINNVGNDVQNNDSSDIDNERFDRIFNSVIEDFITNQSFLISSLNDSKTDEEYLNTKNKILEVAKSAFKERCKYESEVAKCMENFTHYMFGYYILEPLLHLPDKSISDIKITDYDHIRIKRFGKREGSDIKFSSSDDYNRFVRMICARNKKNISNVNAIVKFADSINNPDYILRINITSGMLNYNGSPTVHIRLEAKNKTTLNELVGLGYMTEVQKEYLVDKFVNEKAGFLFIGANASGKTTGLNALIDVTPPDVAVLVLQETEEIFVDQDKHPEFVIRRLIEEAGEGMVRYGFKEHANNALMDDCDTFVLGEVKSSDDAASLPMFTATGSQILFTGHGNNEREGIRKIADYIKQATGYDLEQCLRFLLNVNVVCFIDHFRIASISEIRGWDYKMNDLVMVKLDENCKPITSDSALTSSSDIPGSESLPLAKIDNIDTVENVTKKEENKKTFSLNFKKKDDTHKKKVPKESKFGFTFEKEGV